MNNYKEELKMKYKTQRTATMRKFQTQKQAALSQEEFDKEMIEK
jgi:hypothetical protein